jgi:hypothetical protein
MSAVATRAKKRETTIKMFLKTALTLTLASACLCAAEKYEGPIPPKPDVPSLLHATNLVETELGQARQENRKNDSTFIISGASSPARTPLAEPIFIMDARQTSPERMELYRLDVKNGNREVSISSGKRRGGNRPLHLTVTPLSNHLYRIEADEPLENGEYALSPNGDNRAFCFEIY